MIILKALAGEAIPIYGAGQQVRDWLYVEDHADALLCVLARGQFGRTYNIGDQNEATNIDVARMICAILDEKRPAKRAYGDLITFVDDRPGHDLRYAIDPSRIREELGWRASRTLSQGLELTVTWFLEHQGLVAGAAGPRRRWPTAWYDTRRLAQDGDMRGQA